MKLFTKWNEQSTPHRIVLLLALTVAILAALSTFVWVFEANAAEDPMLGGVQTEATATPITVVNVEDVQSVQSVAGTRCWRATVLGTSPTWLGPRANWGTTVEWCGNNRTAADGGRVTSLPYKRCFDRGGGGFSFDKVIECSREPLNRPSLRIHANLRYHRGWGPALIERFAHTELVLGPRGGISGHYWWSS